MTSLTCYKKWDHCNLCSFATNTRICPHCFPTQELFEVNPISLKIFKTIPRQNVLPLPTETGRDTCFKFWWHKCYTWDTYVREKGSIPSGCFVVFKHKLISITAPTQWVVAWICKERKKILFSTSLQKKALYIKTYTCPWDLKQSLRLELYSMNTKFLPTVSWQIICKLYKNHFLKNIKLNILPVNPNSSIMDVFLSVSWIFIFSLSSSLSPPCLSPCFILNLHIFWKKGNSRKLKI